MSLKYSSTTADYLIWSDAMNLIRKLAKDENYKISLLIALGCFTGLRISDILSLRWKQILGADEFTVIEQKTGKVRIIRLNPQLQQHIKECYEHINPVGINAPILISQKGTIFTVQRINIILKEVKKKYKLKIKNFSCHSLRKTFGRQVYNMNSDNAELALVKLMELFNSDKWAGLSEACLGCGTCTFVCPTCQCYDIRDYDYRSRRSAVPLLGQLYVLRLYQDSRRSASSDTGRAFPSAVHAQAGLLSGKQ